MPRHQQVTEALGSLRGTIAPSSHELNVILVRSYSRWLDGGMLPKALKHAIPSAPAPRDHELQVITDDELRALPAACRTHFPEAKTARLQALLWVLWDTGFRRGELLSLRLRDVQFDQQGGAPLRLPPRNATPLPLKTGPREVYVPHAATTRTRACGPRAATRASPWSLAR